MMDTEYSTEYEQPRTVKQHMTRQLAKKEKLGLINKKYPFNEDSKLEMSVCTSEFSSVSMRPPNLQDTSYVDTSLPAVPRTNMLKDFRFWQGQPTRGNQNIDNNVTQQPVFKTPSDPVVIKSWFPYLSTGGCLCIRGVEINKTVICRDVQQRYSAKRFSDSNGNMFILSGPIHFHDRLPNYIYENFVTGLPINWQIMTNAWINFFNAGKPNKFKWPDVVEHEAERDVESYSIPKPKVYSLRTTLSEKHKEKIQEYRKPVIAESQNREHFVKNMPQKYSLDNSEESALEVSYVTPTVKKLQNEPIINSPQNYTMDFGRSLVFNRINSTPLNQVYHDNSRNSLSISENTSTRSKTSNKSLSASVLQRKIAKLQAMLQVAQQRDSQIDETVVSEMITNESKRIQDKKASERSRNMDFDQIEENVSLQSKTIRYDGKSTPKITRQPKEMVDSVRRLNIHEEIKAGYDLRRKDMYDDEKASNERRELSNFEPRLRNMGHEPKRSQNNDMRSNKVTYDDEKSFVSTDNQIVSERRQLSTKSNNDLIQRRRDLYDNEKTSKSGLSVGKIVSERRELMVIESRVKKSSFEPKGTQNLALQEDIVFKKPNFVPTHKMIRSKTDETSFIIEPKNMQSVLTFRTRSSPKLHYIDENESSLKRKRLYDRPITDTAIKYVSPVSKIPKKPVLTLVSATLGPPDSETDFGSDGLVKNHETQVENKNINTFKNISKAAFNKNQTYAETDELSESFGNSPKKTPQNIQNGPKKFYKSQIGVEPEESLLESCDERIIKSPMENIDIYRNKNVSYAKLVADENYIKKSNTTGDRLLKLKSGKKIIDKNYENDRDEANYIEFNGEMSNNTLKSKSMSKNKKIVDKNYENDRVEANYIEFNGEMSNNTLKSKSMSKNKKIVDKNYENDRDKANYNELNGETSNNALKSKSVSKNKKVVNKNYENDHVEANYNELKGEMSNNAFKSKSLTKNKQIVNKNYENSSDSEFDSNINRFGTNIGKNTQNLADVSMKTTDYSSVDEYLCDENTRREQNKYKTVVNKKNQLKYVSPVKDNVQRKPKISNKNETQNDLRGKNNNFTSERASNLRLESVQKTKNNKNIIDTENDENSDSSDSAYRRKIIEDLAKVLCSPKKNKPRKKTPKLPPKKPIEPIVDDPEIFDTFKNDYSSKNNETNTLNKKSMTQSLEMGSNSPAVKDRVRKQIIKAQTFDTIVESEISVFEENFSKNVENNINNVTASDVSSSIPESIHLIDWKPEIEQKRYKKWQLRFVGDKINDEGKIVEKNYKTEQIIERFTNKTIQTVENHIYVLEDELFDPNDEVPKDLKDLLRCGLPTMWEEKIDDILKNRKKTTKNIKKETKNITINNETFGINSVNMLDDDNMSMNTTTSSRYGRQRRPPVKYWQGERILCIGDETFYQPPTNVEKLDLTLYSSVSKKRTKKIPEKKINIKKSPLKGKKDQNGIKNKKTLPVLENTVVINKKLANNKDRYQKNQTSDEISVETSDSINSEPVNERSRRYSKRKMSNKDVEKETKVKNDVRPKKIIQTRSKHKTIVYPNSDSSQNEVMEVTKSESLRKRPEKVVNVSETKIGKKRKAENFKPPTKKRKTERIVSSKVSKRKPKRYKKQIKKPKLDKIVGTKESDDSGYACTPTFENNKKCFVLLERLHCLLKDEANKLTAAKSPKKFKKISKPTKKRPKKKLDATRLQTLVKSKRRKINAQSFFGSQIDLTLDSKNLGSESKIVPENADHNVSAPPKKRKLYNENEWLVELNEHDS